MKTKIILLTLILCLNTFGQITGTSKPGKIIFKKKADIEKQIIPDQKIPIISIIEPKVKEKDTIFIKDGVVSIKLKAAENSNIKEIKINGYSANKLNNLEYNFTLNLKKGVNDITISTIDNSMNTSYSTFYVLSKVDKIGPTIILLEPTLMEGNEITTSQKKITIKSKIEDEGGIKEVTVNNKKITSKNEIYSYDLNLLEGINSVSIKAKDKNGNISQTDLAITYKVDLRGPSITLIEPVLSEGTDLKINEKSLAVRVKIEDEDGINEVKINNSKATFLEGSEYISNIFLNDGINIISIKAKNKSGRTAEKSFTVTQLGDVEGPTIRILEPYASRGTETIHKNEVIKIRGLATDESGIREVTVNNRKADLTSSGEFSIDMFLDVGRNRIIVKATDFKSNIALDTLFISRKIEDLIERGKFYALIIGINKYHGAWQELNNAVNDAKAVEKLLKEEYVFDEIITLYEDQATRKNIIQKIEWLEDNVKNDDNVLIFYSGHGEFKQNQNRGYWVPIDATTQSTVDYISNPDIQTHLNGIASRHTLLIADACFSGDIFKGRTENMTFENTDRYFKEVYRKASRTALTSGGIEPVTDGGRDGHSVFTYYLLKALKENSSKYFAAGQLFSEIKIPVTNNSEQRPNFQPIKNTGDEGGEFLFIKK
ncbi:MAG: caspase family protein [Ignavibacteriales bacterium]|nr:caspase family protein [Ignavibacteriales bacterium]